MKTLTDDEEDIVEAEQDEIKDIQKIRYENVVRIVELVDTLRSVMNTISDLNYGSKRIELKKIIEKLYASSKILYKRVDEAKLKKYIEDEIGRLESIIRYINDFKDKNIEQLKIEQFKNLIKGFIDNYITKINKINSELDSLINLDGKNIQERRNFLN